MKFPKLNASIILSVVLGVTIYFAVKGFLFADKLDDETLEVTSEFRGIRQPYMRRVA